MYEALSTAHTTGPEPSLYGFTLLLKHGAPSENSDSWSCPTVSCRTFGNEAKTQHFPQSRLKPLVHPSWVMGPYCANVPSGLPSNSLLPNEMSPNNSEEHYVVQIDRWYSIVTHACLLRICVCPQIVWWLRCVLYVCLCREAGPQRWYICALYTGWHLWLRIFFNLNKYAQTASPLKIITASCELIPWRERINPQLFWFKYVRRISCCVSELFPEERGRKTRG